MNILCLPFTRRSNSYRLWSGLVTAVRLFDINYWPVWIKTTKTGICRHFSSTWGTYKQGRCSHTWLRCSHTLFCLWQNKIDWSETLTSGVPNLSLIMYLFNILTTEHVLQKFLMTKTLSKLTKIHWIFNRAFIF